MYSIARLNIVLISGLLLLPSLSSAGSVMKPGGWKMRMKVDVKDEKGCAFKTINESRMRTCLTLEYLDNDPYLTPGLDKQKAEKAHANCSISDEKKGATSSSWTMTCELENGVKATTLFENSATPTKFISNMRQFAGEKNGLVEMRTSIISTFVGKCTNGMVIY